MDMHESRSKKVFDLKGKVSMKKERAVKYGPTEEKIPKNIKAVRNRASPMN